MEKFQDIIFLIKHLSKLLEIELDKNMKELTSQQGRILFYLSHHKNEKIRQVNIEERFSLSKSTVSGLIKRLESKDLVLRKKDKKEQYLEISPKGEVVIDNFKKCNEALRERLFSGIKEEDRNAILSELHLMIDNLEEVNNEGKD